MPAIFVYFILLNILLLAAFIVRKQKESLITNPLLWFAIIIVSLIVGLRWDPENEDFLNYFSLAAGDLPEFALDRIEIIPRYLVLILNYFKMPSFLWFFLMALVQLLFIVLTANNGKKQILPWMFLLYFYSLFSLSLIITRQLAALMVILYAYSYIEKRKFGSYLFFVALAYCFHRTALICIPLYWLPNLIKFESRTWQILIICGFLLFGDYLIASFWSLIPIDQEVFRYAKYVDREFEYGAKTGLGVISNYLRYFIIVLFSNKLKKSFDKGFSIYYSLLFVQICLYKCMMNDLAFSRAIMYFSIADLVVSGFLIHYLLNSKNRSDKIINLLVVSVLFVTIFYSAYNSPDWSFVWNAHLPIRN